MLPEGVRTGRLFFPAAFVLLAAVPTEWLERLPRVCMFRNLFGVDCLACGLTRAFSSVLHGHWLAAWNYNHLVVIAFPLLAGVAVHDLLTVFRAARTAGA